MAVATNCLKSAQASKMRTHQSRRPFFGRPTFWALHFTLGHKDQAGLVEAGLKNWPIRWISDSG